MDRLKITILLQNTALRTWKWLFWKEN